MTALSVVAVPAPPPWRRWTAELWWLLGFADALLLLTLRAAVLGARRIPAMARMPLAAVALAAFMGVKALTGYLADPRPLAGVLLAPLAVLGVVMLFFAWALSGLAPQTIKGPHGGRMVVRQTVTGKTKMTAHYAPSPGKRRYTSDFTAEHEGGHAAGAAGVGGRPLESRAYSDGSGWCSAVLPNAGSARERAIRYMAFIYGGQVAVHSQSGCGHDNRLLDWAESLIPADQRGGARAEARRRSVAAQSSHAHVRREVAAALVKYGRWGSGGDGTYNLGGWCR